MSKGPPRQNRSPNKEGRRRSNSPAPAKMQERTPREPGTCLLVRPYPGTIRRIVSRDRKSRYYDTPGSVEAAGSGVL